MAAGVAPAGLARAWAMSFEPFRRGASVRFPTKPVRRAGTPTAATSVCGIEQSTACADSYTGSILSGQDPCTCVCRASHAPTGYRSHVDTQ